MAATISKLDPVYFNTDNAIKNVLNTAPDARGDSVAGFLKIANDAIEDWSKARNSERQADTLAEFQRRMGQGMSVGDALKGLDSRWVGTEFFQNKANEIIGRDLQQQNQNLQRALFGFELEKDRLAREESAFVGDLKKGVATYGKEYIPVWMEENQDKLQKNGKAYNAVMTAIQDLGGSLAPGDFSTPQKLSLPSTAEAHKILTQADALKAEFAKEGFFPIYDEKLGVNYEDDDKFLDFMGKAINTYGTPNQEDLREIYYGFYRDVQAEAKKRGVAVDPRLIRKMFQEHYVSSPFAWIDSDIQGHVTDESGAIDRIFVMNAKIPQFYNYMNNLNPHVETLREAAKNDSFSKAKAEQDTLKQIIARGILTDPSMDQKTADRILNAKSANINADTRKAREAYNILAANLNKLLPEQGQIVLY